MKNLKKFLILSIMLCFGLLSCLCGNVDAFAASGSNFVSEENRYSEYSMDSTLFEVLKKVAGEIYGYQVTGFDKDFFFNGFKDVETEVGSQGYKIQNDLNNGILNLSTGNGTNVYDCLKGEDIKPIKSIKGLSEIKFPTNIKTVLLDNNDLTSIEINDFRTLTNIRTLSLNNNKISKFELSKSITGLSNLSLANNKIEKINLDIFQEDSNPICVLSSNNISSLGDIVFPAEKFMKLDLSFNLLTDLTVDQVESLNTNHMSGSKVLLYVQGLNDNSKPFAGDKIAVFKNQTYEGLNLIASYSGKPNNQSQFYVFGEDNTICSTQGVEEIEYLFLPAGKIVIEYFSFDTPLDEAYSLIEIDSKNFKTTYLDIPLKNFQYKVFSNGVEVKELKQENNMKIEFSANLENVPNSQNVLENMTIYSGYLTNMIENQSSIEVVSNGTFNFVCYAVFDGINSQTLDIFVTKNNTAQILWGVAIIVIIFVVVASLYFVVRWYRNGAEVAPLSEKELYNVNKRKALKQGYSKREYLTSLEEKQKAETLSKDDLSDNNDEIKEDDLNDKE